MARSELQVTADELLVQSIPQTVWAALCDLSEERVGAELLLQVLEWLDTRDQGDAQLLRFLAVEALLCREYPSLDRRIAR